MHDLIIVGGGLAACLTAYRHRQLNPSARLLIIERAGELGGEHTWSFFTSDLTQSQHDWIAPFIAHRWLGYDVRFPAHDRTLTTGYQSMTTASLVRVMREVMPDAIRTDTEVIEIHPDGVRLADGSALEARATIDARGPAPAASMRYAFQKFTGFVVQTRTPHGLDRPTVMDATVQQDGDYRFFYALPFSPTSCLIEDTRYSTVIEQRATVERESLAYAEGLGLDVERVVTRERGVLPLTLDGDIDAFWRDRRDVPVIGLRAGLFHATTGYSVPNAVRIADMIASRADWRAADLQAEIETRARAHWRSERYLRFLNRMFFEAAVPESRYLIMQRFYRLSTPLIERFYAGRLAWHDKARILIGKPPVPIGAALRCLGTRSLTSRTIEASGGMR